MDYINLEAHPLPITLSDKALGRHQQTIKRQEYNVITKMSLDEGEELRKKLKEMNEMDEEVHMPLISAMPNLACKKSPSKPNEHPTSTQKRTARKASMRH